MSPVKVEIWSDVVCPWCFIGKRRFDTALALLRDRGITEPIEVIYRAYQLDPTAPLGVATPVVEAYAKKFAGRERAEQILTHVTSVAAADNIEFNMDIAVRANTMLCHRALHWALERYGSQAQAHFKETLLGAYFTRGLDVGDADVISSCANDALLDGVALRVWLDTNEGTDAVQADFSAATEREISGVPAFVINDHYMIPGAQDVEVFVNVMQKILSKES